MIPVIVAAALAAGIASDAASEPNPVWGPGTRGAKQGRLASQEMRVLKQIREAASGPTKPDPDWSEGQYGEQKLRLLAWNKADTGDEVEILHIPEQDLWLPHLKVSEQVVRWDEALPLKQAKREAIAGYRQQQVAQQRWKQEGRP